MMTPTIKTLESDEPASSSGEASCGICRRQISRYTCPSCNLFYCSLSCFRSEPHSQCSEIFYRKEIEIGIKLQSAGTEKDRNRIIELLKRIEDQSDVDEDGLLCSDEDIEQEGLVGRFSAIDISSTPADDLLRLMTKKERDTFFAALKDPSSRLARELLESAELEVTRQLPWWEAQSNGDLSSVSQRTPHDGKPELMVIPNTLVNQASRGVSLLYNVCAVLLAYSYVTRHLIMSPLSSTKNDPQDRYEARRILSQFIPFLVHRKSKLLHTSLTDVVISFWSQLSPENINDEALVILLEDVAKFVRPRKVTVVKNLSGEQERTATLAAEHPFATTIMAISDVGSLFSNHDSPAVCRGNHVKMKLIFYAAHILSTPSSRLHALADEVLLLSKSMSKGMR